MRLLGRQPPKPARRRPAAEQARPEAGGRSPSDVRLSSDQGPRGAGSFFWGGRRQHAQAKRQICATLPTSLPHRVRNRIRGLGACRVQGAHSTMPTGSGRSPMRAHPRSVPYPGGSRHRVPANRPTALGEPTAAGAACLAGTVTSTGGRAMVAAQRGMAVREPPATGTAASWRGASPGCRCGCPARCRCGLPRARCARCRSNCRRG